MHALRSINGPVEERDAGWRSSAVSSGVAARAMATWSFSTNERRRWMVDGTDGRRLGLVGIVVPLVVLAVAWSA